MPLRVTNQLEPFTSASQEMRPVLALSKEYNRLYRDLQRYTRGEISGRSYLVAGHRGSGKTMLVHKAIEDLLRDSRELPNRPLFVRLHGPDLLPPKPANGSVGAAVCPANGTTPADNPADKTGTDSPSTLTAADKVLEAGKNDDELVNVLTQMMKCLFRDVTNEFRKCYREAVLRTPDGLKREELLEIAGQFDLELTESLSASRLRSFWQRIHALKSGVLFTVSRFKYEPSLNPDFAQTDLSVTDAGIQEILVLTFLGQAFQVISGKIEEKQKQSDVAKNERSTSLTTAYELKNLLAPVAGLIGGGVVGTQVALSGSNPIAAVLVGLLTGAVVSLGLSFSRSSSKSKELSLESVFIKDRSVPTLSGVLPLLVQRLRAIGLAPVFVVDELDKVDQLEVRMEKLVQHLKYLITENSFSCFLADRRYLNDLNRRSNQIAYAAEYTYFSDRLLVLYQPNELRKFVEDVLVSTPQDPGKPVDPTQVIFDPAKDKEDATRIAYVILHRARLHPIDLRRQIDRLATESSFSLLEMFPEPGYQLEIFMQVAIEWLLAGDDVQTQLSANPDSRQVIYDSLYYISRLWEDASNSEPQRVPGFKDFSRNSNERKVGFVLDEKSFVEYLDSRVRDPKSGDQSKAVPNPAANQPLRAERLSGADFDFLFTKVTELVDLLADPGELYREISTSPRMEKPPSFIMNELPKEHLLEHRDGTADYVWLYDNSGRYLQTRGVNTIIGDVRTAISRIEQLNADLESFGITGGLQTMGNFAVIPRINWRLVKSAIDRLNSLINDPNKKPYGRMSADRDLVAQLSRTLDEFEANIKAAVILAATLAPEVRDLPPTQITGFTPIYDMLIRISQYLQLSASREDDLRKMNAILNSPNSNIAATADDSWPDITNYVGMAPGRPPFDQAFVESAWLLMKIRFTQHFREGVFTFEPQIEDIVTTIKGIEPGRSLPTDLSLVTAREWTTMLWHATAGYEPWVPSVLRVAAALELGLFDLAERFVPTIPDDVALADRWVKDAKLRLIPSPTDRRNVLVIKTEQRSICESWKASQKRGAIVGNGKDLNELFASLKKYGFNRPMDVPIDSIFIELTGDRTTLARLLTNSPLSAVQELIVNRTNELQDLLPYLELPDIYYFAANAPQLSGPDQHRPIYPFILAPKGIDDLIERVPDTLKAPKP